MSESPSRDSSSPRASPLPRTVNLTGTPLGKRWNSSTTIDSGASPIASSGSGGTAVGQSRFSNKSLVNLSLNKSRQNLHSVSCAQLNEDENCLKLLFKGTPLVLPIPKALPDFDLNQQPEVPYHKLILDWVYGYRGKDCRQNLYYLPTGEIVYFTAAVAVLHNVDFSLQRHYLEHTSEIKSMALHPNKLLIATGQSGSMEKNAMPHIRIWNSVSLTTMGVLGIGHFTGPINCLAFCRSENGSLLVAIEDYTEKIMTVWNWQSGGESGVKITETKCSVDPIVACEFNPLDKSQIITAGKTHIAFWTFDHTGAYKKMGIFDTRDKPKYVTCISFTQSGDIVTGDTNGNIAIFGRGTNTIIRLLRYVLMTVTLITFFKQKNIYRKIHDGPVFTLCALRNSGFISGGGKDGKIVLFQDNLSSSNAVYTIEPHFGGVRVVTQGRGAVLFIGTTRNCILMGQLEDTEFTPLVMGHVGEVNALSCGSKLGQFITGGYDRLLQCWDSLTHTVVWSKDIEEPIQCCAVSPADNITIIVGGGSGKWSVYNGETRELVAQYFDGSDVITTVKFSPSGQYVAIGSRDSGIYVYEIGKQSKKFSKIGKCAGHTGSILAIDWTIDDMHMRSNSTSIEVLHWNPHLCRQITNASSVSELQWATQSCILTFETIGIWPENAEDYDVVSAAKSDDSSTLVAGNSNGLIQVYNYPAALPNVSTSHF